MRPMRSASAWYLWSMTLFSASVHQIQHWEIFPSEILRRHLINLCHCKPGLTDQDSLLGPGALTVIQSCNVWSSEELMETLKSVISIYFTFQCESEAPGLHLLDILNLLTAKIICKIRHGWDNYQGKSIIQIHFLFRTNLFTVSTDFVDLVKIIGSEES